MSDRPQWTPGDIETVRQRCPQAAAASDSDICDLLDGYSRRGLRKPVGYAVSNTAEAGRDLAEITARRRQAATASTVGRLREGEPCEHGEPGGSAPHPDSGLPICALCRAKAKAARAADGSGDSVDMTVSPDEMPAQQEEQTTGTAGDIAASPPWKSWSAAELLSASFPEPRFAVDGLIPEGVTVLAGPPKVGKSWMALNLAVDVATGGKALGMQDTAAGDVLYLALEDTPRRLQRRLRKVLGDKPAPDRLALSVQCPPAPANAAAQIRQWLGEHPGARLVIIDVFERIRGPVLQGETHYSADYRVMSMVKKLADEYSIAVVLIHHIRKMQSDDFLNEISGTTGLSGAADTIAVLKRARGEHDGTLNITGRDVEENEYALKFDTDRGRWQLLGPAADYAVITEIRKQIMEYLRENGDDSATPAKVADAIGRDRELVKKNMLRMADAGQLVKEGRGRYSLPKAVPTVPDE